MIIELLETSTLISSLSVIVPLIIALIRFKRLNKMQKRLSYLVMTATIVELVANILWFQEERNLIVYNSYAIINFNFIAFIYFKELNKTWVKPLTILLVVFNLFFLIDTFFLREITDILYYFNSNITTGASLVFILLAISYFFKLLKEIKYQKLEKNPMFWLSSGVTLYYSGTLILFLLSNRVGKSPNESTLYYEIVLAAWGLNSLFNMILNLAYCLALWVNPTK